MSTPQPQAKKVEPARETVPIDHSNPLKPTHALSITHTKHKTIIVQDLSPSLSSLFTKDGLVIEEATKLIDATPAPPTLYTVKKENLLGTHLTVHDKEGKEVAEWNNPILTLHAGQVTIKFLGEQDQNTVTVKPVSHERLSESFELNNKTYIWEAESKHHEFKHLYELIQTTKTLPPPDASTSSPEGEVLATPVITTKKAREIARYVQKHVHGHGHAGGKEGLLVIDSAEVGELVGVLTLIALLENIHKEERFEKAYDNVVGIVA